MSLNVRCRRIQHLTASLVFVLGAATCQAQVPQALSPVQSAPIRPIDQELIDAALVLNKTKITALLAKGANANTRGTMGITPLIAVALPITPDPKLLDLLLRHGADINDRDDMGMTALDRVCTNGYIKNVRLLLQRGAKTDILDNKRYNALAQAAIHGHGDVVQLLLAHGAKADRQVGNGETALMLAAQFAFLQDRARIIGFDRGRVPGQDHPRSKSNVEIAEEDYDRCIKALLANGADPKARSADGKTVLMFAVGTHDANDIEFCRYLIHHGVDVNAQDRDRNSALMYATGDNYVKGGNTNTGGESSRGNDHSSPVVNLLVQSGAFPYQINKG